MATVVLNHKKGGIDGGMELFAAGGRLGELSPARYSNESASERDSRARWPV